MERIEDYISKEHFQGYDPYDFLNSWIPFRWFGRWGQAIAVQAGKLIPFNLRPMMGIKKEENPKGLGLLLKAYSLLYAKSGDGKYLDVANYLFDRILTLSSKKEHFCWGYNFVWANPQQVHPKYMPSSVVTSFVCQGIFEYYKVTKSERAAEVIKSASEYILNDIICSETKEGVCFSYTEEKAEYCYNASALAAELLAMRYVLSPSVEIYDKIVSALDFLLVHQCDDGHWNYSLDINTGSESKQIDFHQGFVLCSITHIKELLKLSDDKIDASIINGLEYYRKEQFFDDGRSLWRVPKEYPVEIHNQAQGIITFSEFADVNSEYLPFAKTIAEWTIKNMQSKKGYFYYRKFKHYTNKISYMRWSNAWMMLALATLNIKNEE